MVQITPDKKGIATNSKCSHQLSSTEEDMQAETLPDRTYSLLSCLHSQTDVKQLQKIWKLCSSALAVVQEILFSQ